MVRLHTSVAGWVLLLLASGASHAQEGVEQTLALQKAMATGRVLLEQNRPREAIEVLQQQLLHANGNGKYLALLRDSYAARLKELQLLQATPEQVDEVRRQLQILERDSTPQNASNPAPLGAPRSARVNAPALSPTPPDAPGGDPFQQVPLDREPTPRGEVIPAAGATPAPTPAPTLAPAAAPEPATKPGNELLQRAMTAYEQAKYREAAQLFRQVSVQELNAEQRMAAGYARLHEISTRLNGSGDEALPVAQLQADTRQAVQLGGEKLQEWGKNILAELSRRKALPTPAPSAALPEGWAALESPNFRILHRDQVDAAREVSRAAELARTAMLERWIGPIPGVWAPRCDVWLHPSGADYTQATGQQAASPGHSTVDLKGTRVVARRIDLRADVAGVLDTVVPHEVTYVILQELFAEQALPRWAESAMTVLSEPPSQVARYLRAVPKLSKESRLMPVGKLLGMSEFPDEGIATPFFVQSVSLVDYLVRLKGAKAFAAFLKEGPRRGYERALQTHYGFKDANDLQEKWLKYASGQ